MAINQNQLAKKVALLEGGSKNLNIGQIKEVIKITLNSLSQEMPSDVLRLLEDRAG